MHGKGGRGDGKREGGGGASMQSIRCAHGQGVKEEGKQEREGGDVDQTRRLTNYHYCYYSLLLTNNQ